MSRIRLILASASPRRRELLETAGWTVEVEPAQVDETPWPDEPAEPYVTRLAREKAEAIARRHAGEPALVLGADTTVVHRGQILGKPADRQDAIRMLQILSGTVHEVHTGVCLVDARGGFERGGVDTTRVWFAPLTGTEIEAYVASGEAFDKAGAYAIQGGASRFIPRIEGSWSNVVGLPIHLVRDWMNQACIAQASGCTAAPE